MDGESRLHPDVLARQMVGIEIALPLLGMPGYRLLSWMTVLY